jgi:hypothetical protein
MRPFYSALMFPPSFNLLVLDNGVRLPAKVGCWPATVASVFLPSYSPALHSVSGDGVILRAR